MSTGTREFRTIGVIGLGTMGAGIAEVFARHGYDVVGVEVDDEGVAKGRQHLEGSTARAVRRGKLTEDEQAQLLGRVSFATSLDGLKDADLVVEAVELAQLGDPERVGQEAHVEHEVGVERHAVLEAEGQDGQPQSLGGLTSEEGADLAAELVDVEA